MKLETKLHTEEYDEEIEWTVDKAIAAKLEVLRDFYIVDDNNMEEIKKKLTEAVEAEPNKHFDIVLDRVATGMIMRKLNK